MSEIKKPKNRVLINLSNGCVEIESETEKLDNVLQKTHDLALKISCYGNGNYLLKRSEK